MEVRATAGTTACHTGRAAASNPGSQPAPGQAIVLMNAPPYSCTWYFKLSLKLAASSVLFRAKQLPVLGLLPVLLQEYFDDFLNFRLRVLLSLRQFLNIAFTRRAPPPKSWSATGAPARRSTPAEIVRPPKMPDFHRRRNAQSPALSNFSALIELKLCQVIARVYDLPKYDQPFLWPSSARGITAVGSETVKIQPEFTHGCPSTTSVSVSNTLAA